MENIDNRKIAKVWQRVHPEEEAPEAFGPDLRWLISQELENGAAGMQLARRLQGSQKALAQQLYRQAFQNADCLKGIWALIHGSYPALAPTQPPGDTTVAILRHHYGRQMQCLCRYESLISDAQYGRVYERLATNARDSCHILLQLLGSQA